jgi:hypothetical protein
MSADRKKVPHATQLAMLIEAGYRCAVPSCRTILAIDLHHIVEVSLGGGDEAGNLLALCPTCHALHHRGTISQEAIFAWKGMLVALGHAFDREAIDLLLFLALPSANEFRVDGTGVLRFARLIAAGFAEMKAVSWSTGFVMYAVSLTTKGLALIEAWRKGDRTGVAAALSGETPPQ